MAEYAERLTAANQSLRFTNIRGKEYADVSQRVLAFWSLFPNGRIETEKTRDDGSRCEFTCRAYRDAADERPAATGHAFEVKSGQVNSTSYVENCETSAVGRALGLLGIGAVTSIASADEMLCAMAQQDAPKPRVAASDLAAAKRELWEACERYAELHGADARAVAEGVKKRPGYAEDAAWLRAVAEELSAS